jgi:hypothetical protein
MSAGEMKKIVILSCAVLFLILVWFALCFSHVEASFSDNYRQPNIPIHQKSEDEPSFGFYEFIKLVAASLLAVENQTAGRDIFSDENLLIKAGSVVNNSVRYLNRNKAVEHFRSSGLDIANNYSASLEQLAMAYENDSTENFLRKRIIAIRFLEMSQHLRLNDCINVMKQLVSKLEHQQSEQIQRNIKLDLYEFSQGCGRIDRNPIASFANSLTSAQARNTILYGLERVNNE